jgi:hypothetical protein
MKVAGDRTRAVFEPLPHRDPADFQDVARKLAGTFRARRRVGTLTSTR